jgi:uncharacterized repeat protein (TIGR03943 family)
MAPVTPATAGRRAALLRALALGLWAAVLLRSVADGRLALLLRSAFHPLVLLSALALLALAVLQLALALRPSTPLEPGAPGDAATALATALLAALLLALPPNPSFADLAAQRPADGGGGDEELRFMLPPEQRSLTDWVRLLRSQPDPSQFEGDPVRISGFVLPQPDGAPLLARLLVRCCLADATPVGLAVRWPAGPPPAADRWLAIEGTMAVQRGRDGAQLVVVPRRIQPIPRPERPLEP